MKRPRSLRFRLLAAVLLAVALSVPFTLWGVYGDAQHELDELFDAQLEQLAHMHLLVNAVSDIALPESIHPYAGNFWRGTSGRMAASPRTGKARQKACPMAWTTARALATSLFRSATGDTSAPGQPTRSTMC